MKKLVTVSMVVMCVVLFRMDEAGSEKETTSPSLYTGVLVDIWMWSGSEDELSRAEHTSVLPQPSLGACLHHTACDKESEGRRIRDIQGLKRGLINLSPLLLPLNHELNWHCKAATWQLCNVYFKPSTGFKQLVGFVDEAEHQALQVL